MATHIEVPPAARLLPGLASPAEVRELSVQMLPVLAGEIRRFLIEKVSAVGGHLGPNLGVVELTIALHRVFESPYDALLFDTGHQAYVHKLLTGRAPDFTTLRQAGGLSGYPSRSESAHDWVDNSHASTALSYADGLAKARHLSGHEGRVVAVVGDGALTGGMAWEALNNLGAAPERPVIVVLNDNGRSYAPTAGALAVELARLRRNPAVLAQPTAGRAGLNLFTLLRFAYIGPVDGHDLPALEEALAKARDLQRPVVVHVVTVKGRGYGPAESDASERMHAVGVLNPVTGLPAEAPGRTWTDVFSAELLALGRAHPEMVALTAAMSGPTGLASFGEAFPERCFDVGIAEQHAVTSAAGLAMGGLHPVVALYATFLNRAFDQLLMDVALHRLPVTFVLDRAGITGPDGPSHHGMWDASLLTAVPGLRLAVPRDPAQLRALLREAVDWQEGPTALRFPKAGAGLDMPALRREGSADILADSGIRDVLLVAYGPMAEQALEAAGILRGQGLHVSVADPRWALPVSQDLVDLAARFRLVLTVEDNSRTGGLGSALAMACRDQAVSTPVHTLGLPRAFLPHGTRAQVLQQAGLSASQIAYALLRARADKPVFTPARAAGSAVPARGTAVEAASSPSGSQA
ncbi:1-deoxy-D-xylulose-5-phosphate synthase [Streptomyces vinaceus]